MSVTFEVVTSDVILFMFKFHDSLIYCQHQVWGRKCGACLILRPEFIKLQTKASSSSWSHPPPLRHSSCIFGQLRYKSRLSLIVKFPERNLSSRSLCTYRMARLWLLVLWAPLRKIEKMAMWFNSLQLPGNFGRWDPIPQNKSSRLGSKIVALPDSERVRVVHTWRLLRTRADRRTFCCFLHQFYSESGRAMAARETLSKGWKNSG